MAELADIIRAGRKAKGMTQFELGIAVGLQNQIVSKWERGAIPEPRNFVRLIAVLDLEPDAAWLAYGRAVSETAEEL